MNEQNLMPINNTELGNLFPFCFSIDDTLKIISAGSSMKGLIPSIINSDLQDQFIFNNTFSISYNFASISEYSKQLIVIVSKNKPEITVNCQLGVLGAKEIVFLASPWLKSPYDLNKFNLNKTDFQFSDSAIEVSQLLKFDQLKNQNEELVKSVEELQLDNKRYSALIQNMQNGILLENKDREIVLTNKMFCEIFDIKASPEELIGYDCEKSAEDAKFQFKDSKNFVESIDKILIDKKLVQNEELEMLNGTVLERDFVPVFTENKYNGHLWIYRNITDRKKNEMDLIFAKEQAIVGRKSKEQFLANMSHELRNPINIIKGITGLIYDTNLSEKQSEYLEIIKTASENLLLLVNDILDFEKIQVKKINFQVIPFDILKCVNEVYLSMKHLAENKNLSLNVKIDDFMKTHHVSGDPLRLKQILFNLVSNAIKFTEKGSVDIRVSMEENSGLIKQVKFEISDTGIGLSKENLSMIFNRYAQVVSETTHYSAGTGLGLTIVKNLVELQNGKIEVESKIGVGSCFYVTIPFEIIEHFETPKKDKGVELFDFSNKRILIVEDDKFNQMITTLMLKKHGAITETADNGEIAIEKLSEIRYDLVLLDLQMPVLNGYKTAENIRINSAGINSKIPIIALTANIISGEKEKCIEAGMNDFLSKPFTENDLVNKVSELTKNESYQESQLVDLIYLKSISHGNNAFYKKLITEFLFQTPVFIEEMKLFVRNEDWDNATETSHKLKGRISFIGTPYFIKTVSLIEAYCQKRQHLNLIPGMVELLEINFLKIYSELNNELKIDEI
ncbi:MAG: ATP-binding protein [Bacteroidetes bacterium]|nr:ATP-binding protein [Bacteroidota bacterium]